MRHNFRKPNKKEQAQKAKAAAAMHESRARLLIKQPFIGMLAMRMELTAVMDSRLPTAATDGNTVFANAAFFLSLKEGERLHLLAHELWHCILLHFIRKGGRERERFNYAADLEVDFMLRKQGFKMIRLLPHNLSWDGLPAEEIYEMLENDRDKREGGDIHLYAGESPEKAVEGQHPETDGGSPLVKDEDYSPSIAGNAPRQWRTRVTLAAQHLKRTKGDLPGYLDHLISEIYRPELNWKEILQQFVTHNFGGERQWLPPNKRYVYRNLYLPSGRNATLSVTVAVDTSGSTFEDLKFFLSELYGIVKTFGRYEITLLECDTEIKRVRHFNEWNPFEPDDFSFTGFGGTDFRPVFDYVNAHSERPGLLIFFTDGYGDAPGHPPDYPVLWVITKDGDPPAGWGWKAKLNR